MRSADGRDPPTPPGGAIGSHGESRLVRRSGAALGADDWASHDVAHVRDTLRIRPVGACHRQRATPARVQNVVTVAMRATTPLVVLGLVLGGALAQQQQTQPAMPQKASESMQPEDEPGACKSAFATLAQLAQQAGGAKVEILQEAIKAVDKDGKLKSLLSDEREMFTVFVPTDEAFEELHQELGVTADELLAMEPKDGLKQLLAYHIVPGEAIMSADLEDGQELPTKLGDDKVLTVKMEGDKVTIEGVGSDAEVITPDKEACNAIVHVIDDVLLPIEESELAAMVAQARSERGGQGASQSQAGEGGGHGASQSQADYERDESEAEPEPEPEGGDADNA